VDKIFLKFVLLEYTDVEESFPGDFINNTLEHVVEGVSCPGNRRITYIYKYFTIY
jgi:hypothetical protein